MKKIEVKFSSYFCHRLYFSCAALPGCLHVPRHSQAMPFSFYFFFQHHSEEGGIVFAAAAPVTSHYCFLAWHWQLRPFIVYV